MDETAIDLPLRRDPRSIDELINAALCEPEEQASYAICALGWRSMAEVLERAMPLCRSFCAFKRRTGARILGCLIGRPGFPRESTEFLLRMLEAEQDPSTLAMILRTLMQGSDLRFIRIALSLASHPHAEVRQAVASALGGNEGAENVETLIALSRDHEPCVRDWATFALGTLHEELDTPELREALADRLDDEDDDTRAEALVGLACRRDPRVVPALVRELDEDCIGSLAIEAAEKTAAPELYAQLLELKEWWDVDCALLDRAITACRPLGAS